MESYNPILKTTEFVIRNAHEVRIDRNKILDFCDRIHQDTFKHWLTAAPVDFRTLTTKEKLGFLLLFNSLSFRYWGSPKWSVEYHGLNYDGSWGLIAALANAREAGMPIFETQFWPTIPEEDARMLFRGNTVIPRFEDRWRIIREMGQILSERYKGEVERIIEKAQHDALTLLMLITTEFPSFYDVSPFAYRYVEETATISSTAQTQTYQVVELSTWMGETYRRARCSGHQVPNQVI